MCALLTKQLERRVGGSASSHAELLSRHATLEDSVGVDACSTELLVLHPFKTGSSLICFRVHAGVTYMLTWLCVWSATATSALLDSITRKISWMLIGEKCREEKARTGQFSQLQSPICLCELTLVALL